MNPASAITEKEAGDLLLAQGKISEAQLEQVRRRQRRLDLVPIKLLFHYRFLPLGLEEDCLTLAFSEPPRQIEQGNLRLLLGKRFTTVLATPSAIHAVIKKNFGLGAETIQKLREERGGGDISQEIVFDVQGKETDSALEATVSAFVDQILQEALRLRATDIHIEPYANSIRLRYRVDGILQTIPVPADMRHLHAAVISRLKIMAGLNIAEKRLPQDGRIAMKTVDEEYDLRVSIMPTKHGEAISLRILGRQSLFLDLGQLGMEPGQEAILSQLTQLPQGMVLLTGPTGSGKTTTLYTALAQANDEGRKVVTFEDPIEYQLDGTVQIQVREQIGLTFAAGLRSVLRHDPDVVLVGEIRDFETAEIAIRAAQTGHLVFSTLHTNDSISTVTRLLEMRIEPYLIASSLVCSISQRLARRICRHCAVEDTQIAEASRDEMSAALGIPREAVRAWNGAGCVECNQKGSRGRVAIYEFFLMSEEVADLIQPGLRTGHLRAEARKLGWRSLREMAWAKVQKGVIPITEQERWTRIIDPSALRKI